MCCGTPLNSGMRAVRETRGTRAHSMESMSRDMLLLAHTAFCRKHQAGPVNGAH